MPGKFSSALVIASLAASSIIATAESAVAGPASQSKPVSTADVAGRIRSLLSQSYPADGPGAAVVVTRRGLRLFAGGRGLSNIAAKRAITTDDPFQLASISKTLTAALVLQLVGDGKLSLDDPLSKYLPDFPAPASGATIRQLLNHNSGIMDYTKLPGFIPKNREKHFTTAELVSVMRALKPVSAPGEKWEYNNGGYVLLGAIVEQVSGQSLASALSRRISQPLGLATLQVAGPGARGNVIPYGGADARAEPYQASDLSIAGAAGNMIASAGDLAKFFNALHHGRIVPPALYGQMIAPAPMKTGAAMPYGFGFRLGKLYGQTTYYQGGALRGGRTETLYLPHDDIFVTVLTNSDSPQSQPRALALRIAAEALGEPLPLFKEQRAHLNESRPFLGRYVTPGDAEILLFERDGGLWAASGSSSARQVLTAGSGRYFFGREDLDWFELGRGAHGQRRLVLHSAESKAGIEAKWVGPDSSGAVAIDPELKRLSIGTYKTETGMMLTVKLSPSGSLTVEQQGREPNSLRPLADGRFAIDGTPMQLAFDRESDRISGLRLFRGARIMKALKVN